MNKYKHKNRTTFFIESATVRYNAIAAAEAVKCMLKEAEDITVGNEDDAVLLLQDATNSILEAWSKLRRLTNKSIVDQCIADIEKEEK